MPYEFVQRRKTRRDLKNNATKHPKMKEWKELKFEKPQPLPEEKGQVTFTAPDGTVTVIPDLPYDLAEITALLSAETVSEDFGSHEE